MDNELRRSPTGRRADDGVLYAWGRMGGASARPREPHRVDGIGGRVVAAAAGDRHAAVLRDDGRVLCFGANRYGQCGVDLAQTDLVAPTVVDRLPAPATQVACGWSHTAALLADAHGAGGRVWCWGRRDYGQLGDAGALGPSPCCSTPYAVPLADDGGASAIVAVACGSEHTAALFGASGRRGRRNATADAHCGEHGLQRPVPWPPGAGTSTARAATAAIATSLSRTFSDSWPGRPASLPVARARRLPTSRRRRPSDRSTIEARAAEPAHSTHTVPRHRHGAAVVREPDCAPALSRRRADADDAAVVDDGAGCRRVGAT